MSKSTRLTPVRAPMGARFSFLLASLLMLLIVAPFFGEHRLSAVALDGFLTLVLLLAMAAVSHSRLTLLAGLVLAIPALGARWLSYLTSHPVVEWGGMLCWMGFLAYTGIIILGHVLRQREVTRDLVAGSLCVYILLGLSWAFAYALLEFLHPGSFHMPAQDQGYSLFDMLYYSLVTLTTVGYGDISPVTHPARGLSTAEAVVGQFYLTVLVARLVGLHISQQSD